jgi:hypothetical protein
VAGSLRLELAELPERLAGAGPPRPWMPWATVLATCRRQDEIGKRSASACASPSSRVLHTGPAAEVVGSLRAAPPAAPTLPPDDWSRRSPSRPPPAPRVGAMRCLSTGSAAPSRRRPTAPAVHRSAPWHARPASEPGWRAGGAPGDQPIRVGAGTRSGTRRAGELEDRLDHLVRHGSCRARRWMAISSCPVRICSTRRSSVPVVATACAAPPPDRLYVDLQKRVFRASGRGGASCRAGLGGQDVEGAGVVALAGRDVVLPGLQQGRLGLGAGAVDLAHYQQLGRWSLDERCCAFRCRSCPPALRADMSEA